MAGRKRIAAKLLRGAAKDLETFGWIQGAAGNEERGFCAIGGIYHAQKDTGAKFDDRLLAYQAVKAVTGQDSSANITRWNDAPGRTKQEVVSAMRKAATALEHGLKV